MNLLAIRLFINKYYDLVFLFALICILILYLLYKKALKNDLFSLKVETLLTFVKTKKGGLLLLTAILLGGFIIRLYKIENPLADWHSFRQADTASVSRTYVNEGINFLYPRYHDISTTQSGLFNPEGYRFVEFPIYNGLHALISQAFTNFSLEIWGRLLSVFAAILTAYILFLIGKKYLGSIGGVLSAFLYLFIPFNIYFTRVILPEPMATMFAVWALWLFIKYVEKGKYQYLGLAIITFSLGLLVKPYVIFYAVPMYLLAYQKWGFKKVFARRELVVAAAATITPLILWRLWEGQFPEGIPFWKWAFNGDGIRFRPAFWYWIFGERIGKLILGIWGMFPFVAGLISFKKERALVHFLGFGMLIYLSIVATANVKHDYYQTLIIPSIALISAQGIITLWNNSGFNKIIVRGIAVFSIVMMLIIGAFQVKEFYKINRPEIIDAGEAVSKVAPANALVIAPYNGDTAFLYHTKRYGWPVVDRPIVELIDHGAQYFVSVDLNHPQTVQYMEDFTVIERTDTYVIIKLVNSPSRELSEPEAN